MKIFIASKIALTVTLLICFTAVNAQKLPRMYFSDSSTTGIPLAKDPVVVKFKGRYLMYYSRKVYNDGSNGMLGWNIGIAESKNLYNWIKAGEIKPAAAYEQKGICAPGALIKDGKVHLFYQTYGNGPKDAICHATSADGINFTRDSSNPIFHPAGDWTNGRAIDAEVHKFNKQYFLYFATRDTSGQVQKQGVAIASAHSDFNKNTWKQATDSSILQPVLPWEGKCVEGASVITRNDKLYMFYAGNYNNMPQQIGVAISTDGITWKRWTDQPFLSNGKPGSWNSSESGHPCIFEDDNGDTYLFYQGNNDNGKTYHLTNLKVSWNKSGPYIINNQ